MLLAIDVGNTQTVYGLWDGSAWRAVWRRTTDAAETEDQIAVWLNGLFALGEHSVSTLQEISAVVCASVVPGLNASIQRLADKWLKAPVYFLKEGASVGLEVRYEPASAVGADRIANALAATAQYPKPIIVVDFGTATTFDVIDAKGVYIGGAILPGVEVSARALAGHTAKLPQIEFEVPKTAIGRSTVHSLQSGIMLGYAGAIDALTERISGELGTKPTVVATGGLASLFMPCCKSLQHENPTLTLDGLRIAYEALR